jgi:hypothetical protein
VFGPSHCLERNQFASSSIGVRHLLQSLATTPLAGPSSSMRRGEVFPSASMSKDRRRTCARRVTPYLPGSCMTNFCALHHLAALVGTDFFTVEVLTLRGLLRTCGPAVATHTRRRAPSEASTLALSRSRPQPPPQRPSAPAPQQSARRPAHAKIRFEISILRLETKRLTWTI